MSLASGDGWVLGGRNGKCGCGSGRSQGLALVVSPGWASRLICHHMHVQFNNITRGLFPATQEGIKPGHWRKSAKFKES